MTLQKTAAGSAMPAYIQGMEDVAPLFDGFIFDLWGCLHDGLRPFPGTVEVLTELKRAHRKVWLLSNAPRRAGAVKTFLTSMGIDENLYDGLMTSGEAAWQALRDEYIAAWGRRCLHIGLESDKALYDGLDMTQAARPEEADMIVCTGMQDGISDPAHYDALLETAAKRGLPMVCANPDRVVHVGDRLIVCPGTLADTYEALGGKVAYFGKPYRGVYQTCLQALGVEKVLAVGDGMPTDIAGAAAAGLSSVLIASGIHREDVPQSAEDAPRMADFLQSWPVRPDYLLAQMRW
jgi:HAD superfamily hydrolase (TIGR01459 family)